MISHPTDSLLSARNSSPSQKAWHLLSLLFTIGRPARRSELAACCTLFPTSPRVVRSLCSIPHSPIFLTSDLFVVPSLVALQFAVTSSSLHALVPRICAAKRFSDGDVTNFLWKRKEFTLGSDAVPFSKRRLFLSYVNGKMGGF